MYRHLSYKQEVSNPIKIKPCSKTLQQSTILYFTSDHKIRTEGSSVNYTGCQQPHLLSGIK